MTNKKWFINSNNQVSGPFDPPMIEHHLITNSEILIWGRGFNEWVSGPEWRVKMASPQTSQMSQTNDLILWKYRVAGAESKKMNLSDLIAELKGSPQLSMHEIWSNKTNEWKEIFVVSEVADMLGLSRRSHPRVPIMGIYEGHFDKLEFKHAVVTISEGGLGLGDAKEFKIGDQLKGVFNTPNLSMPIQCFCEVVYVGEDGYVGLRFVTLPSDLQSLIIAYVNKFDQIEPNTNS